MKLRTSKSVGQLELHRETLCNLTDLLQVRGAVTLKTVQSCVCATSSADQDCTVQP